MKRCLRTMKRTRVVTPGGRNVFHFKLTKPSTAICGMCGAKLNRANLTPAQLKRLPKTQRRSERPMPHLCSRCMREEIKKTLRG